VSGISLPIRTFSKVDLPAPFGPMMAWTEVFGTLRFTLPKALQAPGTFVDAFDFKEFHLSVLSYSGT